MIDAEWIDSELSLLSEMGRRFAEQRERLDRTIAESRQREREFKQFWREWRAQVLAWQILDKEDEASRRGGELTSMGKAQ